MNRMYDVDLGSLRTTFEGRLLVGAEEMGPFLTDWRHKWVGQARCVVQPETVTDVAAVVRWCNAHSVPVVPQGGNTGLSGGATPDPSGRAILVSLTRLDKIRSVDSPNSTLVAEAGCTLHAVQRAAEDAGKFFPLSLAAEGSCTIGGNLATNAGGTAVLRYGNARDLCLGLEVVTAGGDVWNGLTALRKNNAGYDLRNLFIGSEGTLGIITAAVLRLHTRPRGSATALVAVGSVQHAVTLLELSRDALDGRLIAFEIFSDDCLRLVRKYQSSLRSPFADAHAWYILLEVSDSEGDLEAERALAATLERAVAREIVADGVVAASLAQTRELWALRESISESQGREGPAIKHDIALPISELARFVDSASAAIALRWTDVQLVVFGHVGDGNLHFNVSPVEGADRDAFAALEPAINLLVHDAVAEAGGTISAEHGLGVLRRTEVLRYKSQTEIQLQVAIKRALDPSNIMNPGKVLVVAP